MFTKIIILIWLIATLYVYRTLKTMIKKIEEHGRKSIL